MLFILFFLIIGLVCLVIASKLRGKPAADENHYRAIVIESATEKNKRIRVGKIFGVVGVISLSIAGFWFFTGLI